METKFDPAGWAVIDVAAAPEGSPVAAIGRLTAMHSTGWMLVGLLGQREDVPVLLNMELRPMAAMTIADQLEVTRDLLRSIPVRRLMADVRVWVASAQRERAAELAGPMPRAASDHSLYGRLARGRRAMVGLDYEAAKGLPTGEPRRGRKPLDYRQVAVDLLELQEELPEGERGQVVRRLSERVGTETVDTMRSRVKKAVAAGFLISTGQGTYLPGPGFTEEES